MTSGDRRRKAERIGGCLFAAAVGLLAIWAVAVPAGGQATDVGTGTYGLVCLVDPNGVKVTPPAAGDSTSLASAVGTLGRDANTHTLAALAAARSSQVDANTNALAIVARLARLVDDSNAVRNATDYVVSAAYRITITASNLVLGDPNIGAAVTVPAGAVGIGLVAEDTAKKVRWSLSGTPSATTGILWPTAGVARMPLKAADISTMQFIRDTAETGNVPATLLILTPRN